MKITDRIDFIIDEFGTDCTIDGIGSRCIIEEVSDKPIYFDDRIMITNHNFVNNRKPSIVVIGNQTFLAISMEVHVDDKTKIIKIRRIIFTTNFNVNGDVYAIPSIYEPITNGITTKGEVIEVGGKIIVTLPSTNISNQIKVNNRFLKNGNAYKIIGVDRTLDELITITAEVDTIAPDDNFETEIANEDSVATYNIQINNPTEEIKIGKPYQFSVTVYQIINNNPQEYPCIVLWESGNADIATIDETGLCTPVSIGTTLISASIQGKQSFTSFTVTIVDNDVITYGVEPDSGGFFKVLQDTTYTATFKKYLNGVPVPASWVITTKWVNVNNTPITMPDSTHQITTVNNALGTVTLQNIKGNTGYYLVATASPDGLIEKSVQMKMQLGLAW